ncbi:hypothetical protein BDZ45DRAFT_471009 [Acephala macrosclerotiorum]|nr:hypothetical protein BDZ45DRAFT_471009 [Acephala macrosclerotiorum]
MSMCSYHRVMCDIKYRGTLMDREREKGYPPVKTCSVAPQTCARICTAKMTSQLSRTPCQVLKCLTSCLDFLSDHCFSRIRSCDHEPWFHLLFFF